jgi:glutamate decarboxylase
MNRKNLQVCWEKFARYFEVELREVKLRDGYYVMDPEKAVEMVDENTICVAAILGSTLNGEFEDVKLLNDLLEVKNRETGWGTPIHVDAASGGFIAPFLYPELEWDFRLPWVKSINVSGHKYGLVYAGIGWCIWRNKEDLPEELIFHINYLGADQPTFTLNFSKGSSQVIAQYYQLIRHGFEGYRNIMENCHENAMVLKEGLEKTGRFNIVSKDDGVPLVAFSLKDRSRHDEFEISDNHAPRRAARHGAPRRHPGGVQPHPRRAPRSRHREGDAPAGRAAVQAPAPSTAGTAEVGDGGVEEVCARQEDQRRLLVTVPPLEHRHGPRADGPGELTLHIIPVLI